MIMFYSIAFFFILLLASIMHCANGANSPSHENWLSEYFEKLEFQNPMPNANQYIGQAHTPQESRYQLGSSSGTLPSRSQKANNHRSIAASSTQSAGEDQSSR